MISESDIKEATLIELTNILRGLICPDCGEKKQCEDPYCKLCWKAVPTRYYNTMYNVHERSRQVISVEFALEYMQSLEWLGNNHNPKGKTELKRILAKGFVSEASGEKPDYNDSLEPRCTSGNYPSSIKENAARNAALLGRS